MDYGTPSVTIYFLFSTETTAHQIHETHHSYKGHSGTFLFSVLGGFQISKWLHRDFFEVCVIPFY